MKHSHTLAIAALLAIGAAVIAEPAFAQAAAFQAGSTWLTTIIRTAGMLIVAIIALMTLTGRMHWLGVLPLAGGIYVAANPQEVAAMITG